MEQRIASTIHDDMKLLFRHAFYQDDNFEDPYVYSVSPFFGVEILKKTTEERVTAPKNDRELFVRKIGTTLALNQWFCLTLSRHNKQVTRYALNTIVDTDHHFHGRARIDGYIKLGDQALFAEAFRLPLNQQDGSTIVDKVSRMCLLATYYPHLTYNGQAQEPLTKAPIIVLIGECYDHCFALHQLVKDIAPHVRKLYTYDGLLTSQEAADADGCYFEFADDQPRAVALKDLVQAECALV